MTFPVVVKPDGDHPFECLVSFNLWLRCFLLANYIIIIIVVILVIIIIIIIIIIMPTKY